MLSTRSYGLLETTVNLTSDAAYVLDWVDEFLIPSLERRDGNTPDYTVELRLDDARYHDFCATRPAGQSSLAACFALDQEVVYHPYWISDGLTVVQDEKYEVFYVLSGSRVEIVGRRGVGRLRMATMRVVRELVLARTMADERRLLLHAASLQVADHALLLAGPKGSGKSTLLCYIAASTGSRIFANDRSLLSFSDRGTEVRGIPTIVSIRPGTRDLMPGLFERASAQSSLESSATLELSSAQLARMLGVELAMQAPLRAVIFPEHHQDPSTLAIDRLKKAEIRERLLQVRFGLHSGKKECTVFESLAGQHRSITTDEILIGQIVDKIPCFSVRTGGAALRDKVAGKQIVRDVLSGSL